MEWCARLKADSGKGMGGDSDAALQAGFGLPSILTKLFHKTIQIF